MKYWVIISTDSSDCIVMKGSPFSLLGSAQGAAREWTGKASGRYAVVLLARDEYQSSVVVEHAGLADTSDVGSDIPGGGAR